MPNNLLLHLALYYHQPFSHPSKNGTKPVCLQCRSPILKMIMGVQFFARLRSGVVF